MSKPDETFIREQFEFYKNRYDLDTTLNFFSNSIVENFEFNYKRNEIIISVKPSNKRSAKYIFCILLHEIGHAIQHKRGVDFSKYANGKFHFMWNIELAVEKFLVKEYNRKYRKTFGKQEKPMISAASYSYYFNKYASNRTLKNANRRMEHAYARSG